MYFAIQGLAGALSTAISTGLLWVQLRDHNLSFTMPIFVIVFCILSFSLSFILPKSINEIGIAKSTQLIE